MFFFFTPFTPFLPDLRHFLSIRIRNRDLTNEIRDCVLYIQMENLGPDQHQKIRCLIVLSF